MRGATWKARDEWTVSVGWIGAVNNVTKLYSTGGIIIWYPQD